MINAWSLAYDVLNGTLDENFPIKKKTMSKDEIKTGKPLPSMLMSGHFYFTLASYFTNIVIRYFKPKIATIFFAIF